VLGFYALPTVVVAFLRGRHRAIAATAASTLLMGFIAQVAPDIWRGQPMGTDNLRLVDMITWGLTLLLVTYTLGTLRDRWDHQRAELREVREGVLAILGQFLDEDRDLGRHSHRVALHAVTIARQMNLPREQVDLVETAARLHDLGKLDTSRSVLEKAAALSCEEREHVQDHARRGMEMLQPVAASLGRVLPVIMAHHDRYDGGGYRPVHADEIPLEARIIAVADVYDALVSDRPYRRAMAPFEARQTIERGTGTEFDPEVVAAFQRAYDLGLLEVPEMYG
jgi:putative nucleotidyltransferase with HDIG domain